MLYSLPYWVGRWGSVLGASQSETTQHTSRARAQDSTVGVHISFTFLIQPPGTSQEELCHSLCPLPWSPAQELPGCLGDFCPGIFIDPKECHSPKITATRAGCASSRGGDLNNPSVFEIPESLEIIGKENLGVVQRTHEQRKVIWQGDLIQQ